MKTTLASSEFCGPCKTIKAHILKENLDIEIKELGAEPGFFLSNDIRSVPTLVLPDGSKITGAEQIFKHLQTYEKSQS
jgi:predicted DsbA family dithiol-disulfide isomerase